MDIIIEDTLSDEQIAQARRLYEESTAAGGEAEINARFQYAYALLKSKHKEEIPKGIEILEHLYDTGDRNSRRDYLYYVAIGHTRLGQYQQALDCINSFLGFEPENRQAKQLRSEIKNRLTNDGFKGIAIVGGAIMLVGGLISLGVSLAKK